MYRRDPLAVLGLTTPAGNGPDPRTMDDVTIAAFLTYIRQRFPDGPIEPDEEDYDLAAHPETLEEAVEQKNLAQERKIMRVYWEWKAGLN